MPLIRRGYCFRCYICSMKKAKTKNGQPARIYATDGLAPYIYHGAYLSDDGWESCSWMNDGRYFHNPCGLDLDLDSIEE